MAMAKDQSVLVKKSAYSHSVYLLSKHACVVSLVFLLNVCYHYYLSLSSYIEPFSPEDQWE